MSAPVITSGIDVKAVVITAVCVCAVGIFLITIGYYYYRRSLGKKLFSSGQIKTGGQPVKNKIIPMAPNLAELGLSGRGGDDVPVVDVHGVPMTVVGGRAVRKGNQNGKRSRSNKGLNRRSATTDGDVDDNGSGWFDDDSQTGLSYEHGAQHMPDDDISLDRRSRISDEGVSAIEPTNMPRPYLAGWVDPKSPSNGSDDALSYRKPPSHPPTFDDIMARNSNMSSSVRKNQNHQQQQSATNQLHPKLQRELERDAEWAAQNAARLAASSKGTPDGMEDFDIVDGYMASLPRSSPMRTAAQGAAVPRTLTVFEPNAPRHQTNTTTGATGGTGAVTPTPSEANRLESKSAKSESRSVSGRSGRGHVQPHLLMGREADTDQFVCVRPYQKRLDDELDLVLGDNVEISQSFPDGWATGKNLRTGLEGAFPLSTVVAAPKDAPLKILQG